VKKLLKNIFVPHKHNNHTPHVFKGGSIAVILAVAFIAFFGGVMQKIQLYSNNSLAAIYTKTLVALANENREEISLESLTVNPLLEEAARLKAEDMAANGYFAHFGPDGSAPWDWIGKTGYQYAYAGENLAVDFTDSDDVDRAWMKSPTHRANILNARFTEIGIATASGTYKGKETVFVVQMFGTPKVVSQHDALAQVPSPSPVAAAPVVAESSEPKVVATSSTENATSAETFVAVKGAAYAATEPSLSERALANPSKVLSIVFALLFMIVSLGLIGVIFSEFHKHHVKHAAIGVALLAFIVALAFIYRVFILTHISIL
jgi:uncharacterized protein YkwD